jgi:Predicted metal-dependent phosphoesterases (PHP family)
MYLDENGVKWYKGNLHTHTTRSDGARTPDEVVAMYRGAGYDFLALTDHWIRSETVEEKNFLRLSGCEFDLGHNVQEGIFHIVAVGTERMPGLKRGSFTLQGAVDEIRSCGGAAILAHPAWSLNRAEQILPVNGFAAAEIYNSVSGTPWNARPYSGVLIDDLAVLGRLMPCSAADDAHFYNGDQTRSYLMLRAEELTRSAVLAALQRGDFYATQGPKFSWSIADGTLTVHCSPVEEVVFFSDTVYADDRVTCGRDCTEARYQLQRSDHFVRFELRDRENRMAWSSPISVAGR